ncbi:MAG: hypothetical protein EOP54_31635, partial [Sphingobacteriales bacterium]
MNPNRILLSLLCITLLSLTSQGQDLQQLQQNFNQHSQKTLQEKIFVHTDKSTYLAGEIIWFKIYCVDGTYNKPLDVSKVAYVEVLENGQISVLQAKISLRNGMGSGSLILPVSLNNGNYKLRAY